MTRLGRMLTETREAKGLSLDQVERDTRIVKRYIVALEAEDFSVFPAEVYARGFLRSYASYLGLNPADAVELMPGRTPAAPPPSSRPEPDQRPRVREVRAAPAAAGPARRPARGGPRPFLPALVALAAAFLFGRFVGRGGAIPSPATGAPRASEQAGAPATSATSAPPVAGRMPDLRGMDETEALARLAAIGVTPFVIDVAEAGAPPGRVVRQSPDPGATIGRATVTIIIGRG